MTYKKIQHALWEQGKKVESLGLRPAERLALTAIETLYDRMGFDDWWDVCADVDEQDSVFKELVLKIQAEMNRGL